jgi:cystathionine beta-lyase/cystathionine gamma-synthase
MKFSYKDVETKLIHAGETHPSIAGAVCTPIFQSSTFEYAGEAGYDDVRYIRLNNTPNHHLLNSKLAALENGDDAIVTASGMAAISTTLLALLSQGDHFLAQKGLYGGTHEFIRTDLAAAGIQVDFIDGCNPERWRPRIRSNTKLIYVESITNPLLEVADLAAVVQFAKQHELISVIDNTFASPINFRPLDMGFDLSLHSCTKYLNGHTDLVAGAVIGPERLIPTIKHRLNHMGASLDPHTCFLLNRGMKTLALRMQRQNENALRLAQFLENHPEIAMVRYPGLPSHPQHHHARNWFNGHGGMLSFEIRGDVQRADRFIDLLVLPRCAPSLGGVETLITRPATTSHSGMSPDERKKMGIKDTLIRLSVGIESADDLIADLEQAFSAL